MQIDIRLHLERCLTQTQEDELHNLIANGEIRGHVDVYEVGPAVRAIGTQRGSFLIDADGKSADVAEGPHPQFN